MRFFDQPEALVVAKEIALVIQLCTLCDSQALFQYDSAARDLFALHKIEPKNAAAKKELDIVLDMCRKVLLHV